MIHDSLKIVALVACLSLFSGYATAAATLCDAGSGGAAACTPLIDTAPNCGTTFTCDCADGDGGCTGTLPHCLDTAGFGTCQECVDNTHCLGFLKPICGTTNVCECLSNHTACTGSQYCLTGATPSCVECLSNLNCSSTPATPVCNLATHSCVKCVTNADCTGGQSCDASNLCVDCISDANCTSSQAPFCGTTNMCECVSTGHVVCNGTSTDDLCYGTAGSGVCGECLSNTDCPGGYCKFGGAKPICVECLADGNCTTAQAPFCGTTNVCECVSTGHVVCNGTSTDDLCYGTAGSGVCGECLSNTDCSGGYCKFGGAKPICVECLADGNCTTAQAPFCGTTNVCECVSSGHTVCNGTSTDDLCYGTAGSGVCGECLSNTDCPGGYCKFGGAKPICVECLADGNCTTAQAPFCGTTNVCECVSTGHVVCNGTSTDDLCYGTAGSGVCGECLSNTDCPGGYCKFGGAKPVCVECLGNTNCSADPLKPLCGTTNVCECTAHAACSASQICKVATATCVECISDTQCATRTEAPFCGTQNTCECVAATHATCNTPTPLCIGTAGSAVCGTCSIDSDCGAGKYCYTGGANPACVDCLSNSNCTTTYAPFCGTTHVCECVQSTHAACNASSADDLCYGTGASAVCGECMIHADCPAGQFCYTGGVKPVCVACLSNANCTTADAPFCGTTHVCECTTAHTSCTVSPNLLCYGSGNTAVCGECQADGTGCTAPQVCYAGGLTPKCGACRDGNDCTTPPNILCYVGGAITKCGSCTSNAQCTTGAPFCDTALTNPTCKCNFTTGSTCTGATPYCEGTSGTGKCQACLISNNAGCTNASYPHCIDTAGTNACKQCGLNSHCGSGLFAGKPYCVSDLCVACKADNTGCSGTTPICDTTGVPVCGGCTADAQCLNPLFSLCDNTTGACVECLSDLDCGNASYPFCNPNGDCVECLANANCVNNTDGTVMCDVDGVCVECLADSDCTDLLLPSCDITGTCVECVYNDNCTAELSVCDLGVCTACTIDDDCLYFANTFPYCDALLGCVECLSDADCDYSCDTTIGLCQAACTNDTMAYTSATMTTMYPWFAPYDIQNLMYLVFEVEYEFEIYYDGTPLSELALDKPWWYYGDFYAGEIGLSLADSVLFECDGVDVSEYVTVLPGVDNPLGLMIGWQFDETMEFNPNKLVIVLEWNYLTSTDDLEFATVPIWAFGENTVCTASFSNLLTNETGLCLEDVLEWTAPEAVDCDVAALEDAKSAMADAVLSYAGDVAFWSFANDEEFYVSGPLALATLPMTNKAWLACEQLVQTISSWGVADTTTQGTWCFEPEIIVNTTCMDLEADYYSCWLWNDAWETDPCCNPDVAECCAERDIPMLNEDVFGTLDVSTCVVQGQATVEADVTAFTAGFNTAPEDFSDLILLGYMAYGSLSELFDLCEDELYDISACEVDDDCFTQFCIGGYCALPTDETDEDLAMFECIAYTALCNYDDYSDLADFLYDNYVDAPADGEEENVTTCTTKSREFVALISDEMCSEDEFNGMEEYVCPGYAADYVDVLIEYGMSSIYCWLNVTANNETACLEYQYCNWAYVLGDNQTLCEDELLPYTGFCADYENTWDSMVTQFPGCYLFSYEYNDLSCSDVGGVYDETIDACLLDADNETQCYPSWVFDAVELYGEDSYSASLVAVTLCIDYLANETTCVAPMEWLPTLDLCATQSIGNKTMCEVDFGFTWYQARMWTDGYMTTQEECESTYCMSPTGDFEQVPGQTEEECALSGGWCDVETCAECFGDDGCLVDIPDLDCLALLGAYIHSSGYCLVPAQNELECDVYNGTFYTCDLAAAECSDYLAADNSTLWSCILWENAPCYTQVDCEAAWACNVEGGYFGPESTPFCLIEQDCGDNDVKSMIPGFCRAYRDADYVTYNASYCVASGGEWIEFPETQAECETLTTMTRCVYEDGSESPYYTGCEACGGAEYFYYYGMDGEWTNNTLVPGAYVYRYWAAPAVESLFSYGLEVNETDAMEFYYGFMQYAMANSYMAYALAMFDYEEPAVSTVACMCTVPLAEIPATCLEAEHEYTFEDYHYNGTAVEVTYAAQYPGGSVMTLSLPAGLPANLTISVTLRAVIDFSFNSAKKRAADMYIGIYDGADHVGTLMGDGYDITFSVSPLPLDVGICVTQASFLQTDANFPVPDYTSFDGTSAFTFLDLETTYDTTSTETCSSINSNDFYFPSQKAVVTSGGNNTSSGGGGGGSSNTALAALAVLVLLILIPVVIVAVIFALRSKKCKKNLRRVAPK